MKSPFLFTALAFVFVKKQNYKRTFGNEGASNAIMWKHKVKHALIAIDCHYFWSHEVIILIAIRCFNFTSYIFFKVRQRAFEYLEIK